MFSGINPMISNTNPCGGGGDCVSMYIEPVLNRYHKTYQDVITFSDMPPGPIRRLVKPIRAPKLSPWSSQPQTCTFVLMRTANSTEKTPQAYLTSGDLPAVMAYLHENGYIVDTHLSNEISLAGIYMGAHSSPTKRCVAIISYSA